MIRNIRIRNFAIIENAEVEFNEGLNIITGETGAGKSIVIEAVSLALGSRADTAFVRSGQDKAVVQMVADFEGQEYIITREISSNGRNVCRINDEIVTLGTLSSLCKKIADIHGQYDHQSLLNPDNHIKLVDLYNSSEISEAKAAVNDLYGQFTDLRSKLNSLDNQLKSDKREQDFMAFELKEILDANLLVGEDEELEQEITLLENSEKIYGNLAGAYQITTDSEFSLISAMKQVSDMVDEISQFSPELAELGERLGSLYYEYEDACSTIREERDRIVFDPAELDRKIERMEHIRKLKNKHGRSIAQLLEYAEELSDKLSHIENADEYRAQLLSEIEKTKASLTDACALLSDKRKASAASLEKLITEQLGQLSFKDAKIEISFSSMPEGQFSAEGTDIVEFLITTNRGESLKPLSKIASGGEMSRIMLAFKKIIGDYDQIPTMIFDEIDSGISGIAASVVGRKLLEIADNHQIICITHLPQIAAYGKSSYRISKHSDDSMTYTTVEPLDEEGKVYEIARLLGGENITDTTLKSAQELINASK